MGGIAIMVSAYFQSVGMARKALTLTLGGIIFIKLPVLILAARLFALNGIWAAEVISELILCCAALFMLQRYQHKMVSIKLMDYSL